MASSNHLTEDQLVEGIITRILKTIFNRRTQVIFKTMKDNPALKRATDDFIEASDNLDKALRKRGIGHIPTI